MRKEIIAGCALVLVIAFALSLRFMASIGSEAAILNVEEVRELPTSGAAVAVAWSPDGSEIAAASNFGGEISVWDRSGHLINRFNRVGGGPALGGAIAFGSNSSQIVFPPPEGASNDTALSIWDVSTGQIVRSLDGPEPGMNYDFNRGEHFAVSADQKILLSASNTGGKATPVPDGNLISYRTVDWQKFGIFKLDTGVFSVCIFEDGKSAAAGLPFGRVAVIDLTNKSPIRLIQAFDQSEFGNFFVAAVAGSPDGRFLAVGAGIIILDGAHYKEPEASDWEKSIVAVRVLQASDGTPIASLTQPRAPIRQMAWDPKGRYVAMIDGADFLYIWQPDVSQGAYKKVKVKGLTLSLAISPDGSEVAVTTGKGVRIFSVAELR